ncbi:RDD family protein [Campylobacter gastrosuis]|uniref:RDD family protein n=1 Tax=Campylobacter gastrosuis TaxID=2974576 RepID=A0ABT7HRP1_9BACT|nr:RDD family protein [Campylobacter gastrosuis]MDL0089298.1 RDD family protein [Campylobacter gastrosuis]
MSKQRVNIAPITARIKAFIVDMFMILMPILYIATYVVLDGKDDFKGSQIAIFICNALFGVFLSIFFSLKAQTPGYKSQQIYLISLKTGRKISFFHAIFRYICFVLAGFSLVGLLLCFFRKDRLNFHDIITNSAAVIKKLS